MWIRIDTDIADNEKIQRARNVLGLSTGQMVGHYVMMLCKLGHYCPDAKLADVHATTLEEYARWQGEPGAFDRAIRENFVTDGVLDGWEERQGKLMLRQERDRTRKKAARAAAKSARPQDRPQDAVRTVGSPSGGAATVNGYGYGNGNNTAAASAPKPDMDYTVRCTVALNTALRSHPKIGRAFTEIASTTQAGKVSWAEDGIPVEVAEQIIRDRVASFKPTGTGRQIHSLSYFDSAVRERWATLKSDGVTSASVVPGATDVADAAWLKKRGF